MGKAPDEKLRFIRDQFKREMARQFLQEIEVKIAFVYTALLLFFYEERMQRRIFMWRKEFQNSRIGETGGEEDDLRNIFASDWDAIVEEEEFVKANLTCAQMAIVVKEALDLPRFLLIIDNVDRLHVGAQPHLFSVAIDIHHGGQGQFGTVVAIRKKNLMRFEEAGAAGDIVRVVSLSQVVEETHPVRLHKPTPELARAVLEKRQKYVDIGLADDKGDDHDDIARAIFSELKELVNDEFVEDQLYNVANHSIKQLLTLNLDFIKFLYRLIGADTISYSNGELDLPEWQVHSYLYRWLFTRQTADQPFFLDIVSKYARYEDGTLSSAMECDIEVVILAWLARRNERFLRLSELVRAFDEIGVDADVVITSLYRMYDVELLNRYVELSDSEEHVSLEYCYSENPRVSLNPLGSEFVSNTITKLEFLYQCLVHSGSIDPRSDELLARAGVAIDRKVQTVLSHLQEVLDAHLSTLRTFAAAAPQIRDFETFYRRRFCIGNKFILERTVVSHLAYLRFQHRAAYHAWRDPYSEILDSFYEGIGSEMTAQETLANLDADN